MTRRNWLKLLSLTSLPVLASASALGQSADKSVASPVVPVQSTDDLPAPPQTTTPTATPPAPVPPPAPTTAGSTSSIPISTGGGLTQAGGTPTQALNAPDLGTLLNKSDGGGGVEVQKRNGISNEPRIRGERIGQYNALADGAPYFPGRLDLDSPVSRFDPSMIQTVNVIRGPYAANLGPAFSFLDIVTNPTPRAKANCGPEVHGLSAAGYQGNGSQWNGLQTLNVAGADWGFRGSYNILQGNDYKDGSGRLIPASYRSQNVNLAFGYDLTSNLSVEFKVMRSVQNDLEFPGLFFDVDKSDLESYSVRLVAKDYGPFDRITLDTWYNATTVSGSTRGGAKQQFVNNLIAAAFGEPSNAGTDRSGLRAGYGITDHSTTNFAERSIGYRVAGQLGDNLRQPTLTFGTDLNAFGQGLRENINFTQYAGPDVFTGRQLVNGQTSVVTQQQSIPESNSVNVGGFLQGMLPLTESLKLTAGGRVDGVRASTTSNRLVTGNADLFGLANGPGSPNRTTLDTSIYSSDPRRAETTREFTLLSAFLTSEYKLTKETTLFVGYGYAERAPTLTELYANGPFVGVLQQGTSRLIGDAQLAKERLNQFDIGVRYDTAYLKAGVTGFYSLINDYITYDANRTSASGLTQVVYTNTDLATLAGTEMYLQANVTKWLSPFATLSYVQGVDQTHVDRRRDPSLTSSRRKDAVARSFATDTEPLPQISPLESRMGLRVHGTQDIPKWQVEVSTRVVTGQNAIASSLGEVATPGFTTFDLRAFWQVNERLLVSGGCENFGDKLYREHLDPISANLLMQSGRAVPVLFRPGANFFFRTELRY